MLSEVQIIILAVVIGVVGLFITYRVALHFIRKRSAKLIQETRKAAFAISGNLVVEYTSPITDNYRLTKTLLGRGASAEVFVGENINNNHRYAIKVIDMSRKDVLWRYEREKNFLKDIEHSNTVRLFEVYSSPKQMFFVMELCTGGHLGHLLKRTEDHHLPELQARTYILQIVRAIVHCHEHGICHRDIKLQNILLENNTKEAQVKIIDFGNAVRFLGCTPLKKVVGTTYTAAPEVFRQSYDERCDVWSLGVVAYILLSGRRPFERVEIDQTVPQTPLTAVGNASRGPSSQANLQQILPPLYHNSAEGTVIASILMGRYHFHHEPFKHVSREAIYFIKTCLQADYQQRSFAKDLLSHAWLRSDFPFHQHASYRASGPAQSPKMSGPSSPAAATAALGSPISPPPFSLSPQPVQQRYMYAAPVISATGAQTLIESTHRHLSRADHTGMRNASMLAVAFSMPVLKVRKFRDLFQEIDRNGNGLIEKDEFRAAMLQVQSDVSHRDIDLLFDCIDQNGDGTISFLEFIAAMIDPREVDIKEMNQAFRLLDKDRKGFLTKEDLVRVLCTESAEGFDLRKLPTDFKKAADSKAAGQKDAGVPHKGTLAVLGWPQKKAADQKSSAIAGLSRSAMAEIEKEWARELERHRLIESKVDKLFASADWNQDGQLSYTEFLFAMAEGSSDINDFIQLNSHHLESFYAAAALGSPNDNSLPPSSSAPALSPSHQPAAINISVPPHRRLTDGVLKHGGSGQHRQLSPDKGASEHQAVPPAEHQFSTGSSSQSRGGWWDQVLRSLPFLPVRTRARSGSRKKRRVLPEGGTGPLTSNTSGRGNYVSHPLELKVEVDQEPVEFLDDSPLDHYATPENSQRLQLPAPLTKILSGERSLGRGEEKTPDLAAPRLVVTGKSLTSPALLASSWPAPSPFPTPSAAPTALQKKRTYHDDDSDEDEEPGLHERLQQMHDPNYHQHFVHMKIENEDRDDVDPQILLAAPSSPQGLHQADPQSMLPLVSLALTNPQPETPQLQQLAEKSSGDIEEGTALGNPPSSHYLPLSTDEPPSKELELSPLAHPVGDNLV